MPNARECGRGDVVRVFNDRGWVLGGVYVTERIVPGAVLQDHGARVDAIVAGGERPRRGQQPHCADGHDFERTQWAK